MKRRLEAEGRWAGQIELERNDMMVMARQQKRFKTKDERQQWVYAELDRMYPPPVPSSGVTPDEGNAQNPQSSPRDDGQI